MITIATIADVVYAVGVPLCFLAALYATSRLVALLPEPWISYLCDEDPPEGEEGGE